VPSFTPCGLHARRWFGRASKSAGRLVDGGLRPPSNPGAQAALAAAQKRQAKSSSSYAGNPNNAWNVNFDDGNVNDNNVDNTFRVRCVR
jgi:hypothetical protein